MRVVDLFCGCGGLSLGFEKAGFNVVAAYDKWDAALHVYNTNFDHPAKPLDLTDVNTCVETISALSPNMIIGGPPCQDFSSAGKRDEDNGRGDLTVNYAEIISKIKPPIFVMENVDRIVKTNKLVEAKKIFKEAGYGLSYRILDASYCGVPQKRKRFFMVGVLGEKDGFLDDAFEANLSKEPMTVRDFFGNSLGIEYYYRHPRSYARRGIFSIDEPSPTVRGVNRPMPDGYEIHSNDPVRSKEGIRPLTTKERSLIQTFPKEFHFEGSKTDIEQMIGNAVPVNLAKYVATIVASYLDKHGHPIAQEKSKTVEHPAIKRQRTSMVAMSTPVQLVKFSDVAKEYPDKIVSNKKTKKAEGLDTTKNLLVSLVKNDTIDLLLDGSINVYYTGKKFPSTVELNHLYYFMPYRKGKGIRDLYYIKVARVGSKHEVHPESDPNDLRLVFEIEFVKQLFDDYKPIELKILHTFTDTKLQNILSM